MVFNGNQWYTIGSFCVRVRVRVREGSGYWGTGVCMSVGDFCLLCSPS